MEKQINRRPDKVNREIHETREHGRAKLPLRRGGIIGRRSTTALPFGIRKPFRVLVGGAAPVGDALAAQKGDVSLHPARPSGPSGTDRAG